MSTGSPWAPRNCGPRPPCTAPSWPRSPSAMPRGRAARGCCWPGASAGGLPRWRSPRCGRRPTRSSTPSLAALRSVTRQLEEARRPGQAERVAAARSSSGWRAWCAPARCGLTAAAEPRPAPRSARRTCSTSSARPSWSRSSTSTACCTCWSAGRAKVRQFTAGRRRRAIRAADFARFALRRLARSRPGEDPAQRRWPSWRRRARGSSRRCSARPSGYLGDGPVIIVPPGRLHAIPGALMPALRDRVVSVAPSARAWLRARRAPAARPPPRHPRPRARAGLGRSRGPAGRAGCTTTSRCWTTARPRPTRCCPRWTGRGWRTSPRTGSSAPTARCSPRCGCTTGR